MILYPAIDLLNGQCVRLYQGDFEKKVNYSTSPIATAQAYQQSGAHWLHLVDLEGARHPEHRQLSLIKSLIKESGLYVQTGGGIRSEKDVEALLNAGASRIVIGSLAVFDQPKTKQIIQHVGAEHICLAADVHEKEGQYYVQTSGWQKGSHLTIEQFIEIYADAGLQHLLCTDIACDGTLSGCNTSLYKILDTQFPRLKIQASGGIHTLNDLKALPTAGAVIGKALYEGAFTLEDALEAIASC